MPHLIHNRHGLAAEARGGWSLQDPHTHVVQERVCHSRPQTLIGDCHTQRPAHNALGRGNLQRGTDIKILDQNDQTVCSNPMLSAVLWLVVQLHAACKAALWSTVL